jgi:hypothetical protein
LVHFLLKTFNDLPPAVCAGNDGKDLFLKWKKVKSEIVAENGDIGAIIFYSSDERLELRKEMGKHIIIHYLQNLKRSLL